MSSERPNPDDVLANVAAEERHAQRGRLRIFFGYAAGVGKTYTMLEAARREKAAGLDVVVGYVEPHGRRETEALLEGFETLPFKQVEHRGVTLREFDLDAALARRPELLLVDELAHTNAPGSRHAQRWQDVVELLEAGIDVWTTLNVQHIESLNDVIAQITGVTVQETLPDAVFEQADEIELIDITPEELLDRLRAGKVYVPEQAARAIQNFFQKSNLAALREISLRRSADRIHEDVQLARRAKAGRPTWATSERLLVCVSPSPYCGKVIRTAKRLATALHAEWGAAYVVPPGQPLDLAAKEQLAEHLRLAERLGAETIELSGANVAEELIGFARQRNVTKIVIGKTETPRWRAWLFGSVVDDLLANSGTIDVYIIRGTFEPPPPAAPAAAEPIAWGDYLKAAGVSAVAIGLSAVLSWLGLAEANVAAIILLGVVVAATWLGIGPAIFTAVASVLAFDFFLVEPRWTFAVNDTQYVITFAVTLVVGLVISTLTARLREQAQAARERERRTDALYRLSRQLAGATGSDFLVAMARKQLRELLDAEVAILLPDEQGRLTYRAGQESEIALHKNNFVVAQWAFEHEQLAGAATETLPSATAMFLPLAGSRSTVGVLGVQAVDNERLRGPDARQLLETCASLTALAIERDQLALEAQEVRVQAEAERLRSALLSSVSHDLRTPLAVISGASSSLLSQLADEDGVRGELLSTIHDEAQRLARLVDNLLEMTRIEAQGLTPQRQWHVVEEIVGSALGRLAERVGGRPLVVEVPAELPLVRVDGVLLEQVLINLLDNALKYSPPTAPVRIAAAVDAGRLLLTIDDAGPGLAPGEEERIFDKFHRGSAAGAVRGSGLGLAICRAIVLAHGGEIGAANLPGGGARFWLRLPLETPPMVKDDA